MTEDLEQLMDSLLDRLELAESDKDRLAIVAAVLAVRRVGEVPPARRPRHMAVWEMHAALAAAIGKPPSHHP